MQPNHSTSDKEVHHDSPSEMGKNRDDLNLSDLGLDAEVVNEEHSYIEGVLAGLDLVEEDQPAYDTEPAPAPIAATDPAAQPAKQSAPSDESLAEVVEELERADDIASLDQTARPPSPMSDAAKDRVEHLLQHNKARDAHARARNKYLGDIADEATKRIKKTRQLAVDAARQAKHRAKLEVRAQDRLDRLERAVAMPEGPTKKLLEQLRRDDDGVITVARFWCVMNAEARRAPGEKVSADKLANVYGETWGEPMNRQQAGRCRNQIARLEAKGGPWYRLRG